VVKMKRRMKKMTILKVTPNAMMEIYNELKQVSLNTKIIIEKYNEILSKLNSGWEGEEQINFECNVTNYLQYMKQLTEICDEYSEELSNIVRCYQTTESSLVNNVSLSIPSELID